MTIESDIPANKCSSQVPAVIYYGIFFASGFAALVYQISWARQLGTLLGHTAQASAIVLGSFFAGMAVGYRFGPLLCRSSQPLRMYGLLELAVGLWALVIPFVLTQIDTGETARLLVHDSHVIQTLIRSAFCFMLLLPATAAMGATLPLMASCLKTGGSESRRRLSLGYAVNTAGAFIGVVAATFFLLQHVGVRGSGSLAAGISIAVGCIALMVGRIDRSHSGVEDDSTPPVVVGSQRVWFVFAAVSGFVTLGLEVLYTRLLSLVFHNSSYTFGIVVAATVLSLTLGAAMVSTRWMTPSRVNIERLLFATGAGVLLSALVFIHVTGLEYLQAESFGGYVVKAAGLAATVIVIPMTTAGMVLPAVWRNLAVSDENRAIGRVTMVNSLAASAGAIATSFLVIPAFGMWNSFAVVGISLMVIAVAGHLRRAEIRSGLTAGCLGVLLVAVFWNSMQDATQPGSLRNEELVQRWESAYGWIDVTRDNGGVWSVRQNLHYRHGASGETARAERRQALIPLLLHQEPRNVLFLGLGTGVTVSGALPFSNVESITAVELIPEVVQAADFLREFNHGVTNDPRVTIRVDDARHDLLAHDAHYDVIVSDLFVPWESHTGYLYTVEHYRTLRTRLKNGGLFCQWLPLYQLGEGEFEAISNSFATVFPETTLWWGQLDPRWPVIGLIGTEQPLALNERSLNIRCSRLSQSAVYSGEPILSATRLLSHAIGSWPTPQADVLLNTDEHPVVEFRSPLSRGSGRLLQNETLRDYWDVTLSKVVHISQHADGSQNAIWQRWLLFGEPGASGVDDASSH